jgi:hypothetical protein
VIHDFYTWLWSYEPLAQLAIALILIAGLAVFLLVFRRGRDEPRYVRWIVAVAAALMASLIAVVLINLTWLALAVI